MCNIVKPVLQPFILLSNCVPKGIYITTCRQFEIVLPLPPTSPPQPSLGYRQLVLIKIQLLLTIWWLTQALRTVWDETFLMLGHNDSWKLTNSSGGIESDTSLHDQHIFLSNILACILLAVIVGHRLATTVFIGKLPATRGVRVIIA